MGLRESAPGQFGNLVSLHRNSEGELATLELQPDGAPFAGQLLLCLYDDDTPTVAPMLLDEGTVDWLQGVIDEARRGEGWEEMTVTVDAASAMNLLAEAVQNVLGELDEGGRPFLPLHVRYGAAEAAVRVVAAWKEKGVEPAVSRRQILCAHADRNGEGAHWKDEGEPCPFDPGMSAMTHRVSPPGTLGKRPK